MITINVAKKTFAMAAQYFECYGNFIEYGKNKIPLQPLESSKFKVKKRSTNFEQPVEIKT